MQKIETYLAKEKNYGTIGIWMIKTIKTLNPSFSLPNRHHHKGHYCSETPAISDASPTSNHPLPHRRKHTKLARATLCSCSMRCWPRWSCALFAARAACASACCAHKPSFPRALAGSMCCWLLSKFSASVAPICHPWLIYKFARPILAYNSITLK